MEKRQIKAFKSQDTQDGDPNIEPNLEISHECALQRLGNNLYNHIA